MTYGHMVVLFDKLASFDDTCLYCVILFATSQFYLRHLALSKALWEVAQDKSADVRRAAAGQLGLTSI